MASRISIEVRGMQKLRNILSRMTQKARTRTDLHARWAVLALNWINRNFQSEGALRVPGGWKKLSANTLANRRGGSGRILQDKGILRASFIPRWNSEEASVGSPLKIAEYHEKGTGPYTIQAKPGKVLRFKTATQVGTKTKTLKSGKTITLAHAKGVYTYARKVNHPGLTARPMLPRANEPTLVVDLLKAAQDYMRTQGSGGNT